MYVISSKFAERSKDLYSLLVAVFLILQIDSSIVRELKLVGHSSRNAYT